MACLIQNAHRLRAREQQRLRPPGPRLDNGAALWISTLTSSSLMVLEEAGDGKLSTPLLRFSARPILRGLRLACVVNTFDIVLENP